MVAVMSMFSDIHTFILLSLLDGLFPEINNNVLKYLSEHEGT